MMKRVTWAMACGAAAMIACAGDDGQNGVAGQAGQAGQNGEKGEPGNPGAKGDPGLPGDAGINFPGPVPAGYAAADGLKGGLAYSKWWVTQAGGKGNLAAAGVSVGAEWVRCKTCHAWDGRGNAASYASRTGQSTGTASRPDVSTVDLRTTIAATTPQQLFDLIRGKGGRPVNTQGNNRHPDYSTAIDDAQVWNLVKFMREEWIHPDALYRLAVNGPPVYTTAGPTVVAPTLTFYGVGVGGNATNGNAVYTASCTGCHGATGTGNFAAGETAGSLARTKPHEVWHKVKFGEISDNSVVVMQPGLVTSTTNLVDLYKALADTTTFPNPL